MNATLTSCALAVLAAFLLAGCSEPDESRRIDGPGNGVTYVIETTYGEGAPTADYTTISAIPRASKHGDKVLVLSGENLDISVTWIDANNVDLCLRGGITDRYANQVMVGPTGNPVKIRNHIVEHCVETRSPSLHSK